MRIRRLRQDDFLKLNTMDWSPLTKERDSIYLIISIDQSECSFIAEDNGKLLGVLLCTRSAKGQSIYINHLLVKNRTRKSGVGTRLMARLEAYAKKNGVRRIWFMAYDDVVGFYVRLGYRKNSGFISKRVAHYLRTCKKINVLSKRFS